MPSSQAKPTAKQYEQASRWVSSMHDCNPSPAHHRAFQAWLQQDVLNHQAYQEVEAYWQRLDGLSTLAQPQLNAARALVRQKQIQRRWLLRQPLVLAASILFVVLAVPFIRFSLDNGNYKTAKGEHKSIQLSDGSRIDLNTDTEVQVSYTFSDRKVKLEHGEALFTVQHDAEKPFQVLAAEGLIQDIGTQFNVYRQSDSVAVTVLEGEVSVTHQHSNRGQNLIAGMQLTYGYDGRSQNTQDKDFTDVAAWREGKIVFKGQRLDFVLQQLARYHPVSLSASNTSLGSLKVSGSFPTEDLNLALNTIAASLPVSVIHQSSSSIVLVASGKIR
jgi:transmembrane sensor